MQLRLVRQRRSGLALARALAVAMALALAVALAGAPAAVLAARGSAAVDGVVARVIDGDSLWVQPAAGGAPIEVRLLGIDAPEICQEGGREARAFLTELVAGGAVQLRVPRGSAGRDEYGRTLARLRVGEVDVNRRLVEEGHAWSQRYKWDRGPYIAAERTARALRRGLHRAGAAALMPRDFRRLHGPCRGDKPAS